MLGKSSMPIPYFIGNYQYILTGANYSVNAWHWVGGRLTKACLWNRCLVKSPQRFPSVKPPGPQKPLIL